MARRTLERRFQTVMGPAVTVEILRMRIERIKRRLVESDRPINGLALEGGFNDATQMGIA